MQLNDWLENHFNSSEKEDWQKIFQDYFSINSFNSNSKIIESIVKCDSIKNISNLFPIILSSGEPQIALAQLIEFSKSYSKKYKKNFCWDHPVTKFLVYIFGRSNFLSNRIIKNPEIAKNLLESPFIFKKKIKGFIFIYQTVCKRFIF